jgi:S1 RNA binding domain protein
MAETMSASPDENRSSQPGGQEAATLQVGSVVEGHVTGITNFGAFIELPGGKAGLVHISEVADVYVTDVRNHLKEQDVVQVKILGINDRGKYDLSIKQVGRVEPMVPPRGRGGRRGGGRYESSGNDNFEDKLSRFLKESEERLLDLKRNTEAKRGRGRAR